MKGNRIFSKKFGLILLLPSALIFLLVSVYPLCTGLILSFILNFNYVFQKNCMFEIYLTLLRIIRSPGT